MKKGKTFNLLTSTKEKMQNIDVEKLKKEGKVKVKKAYSYYKNNTKKCIIAACVLLVVAIGVNKGFQLVNKVVAESDKGVPVEEMEIKKSSIDNELVYSAKVEAKSSIPVVLKASGEVKAVYVTLGQQVKEGDVLFSIDEKDIRKNIRSLQAAYNAAMAGANAAKIKYNNTLNGTTDIEVINSKSQRDTLEAQYKAAVEMHSLGAMSDVEFNQLKSSFEAADKGYNILVDSGVQGTKDAAYSQYQQCLAQAEQARVQLENAQDLLKDARVKAPIDGIISTLNVKEKTTLQAGATPCTVVNTDELEVNLQVVESAAGLLKDGDEVIIRLNAFPDKDIKGTISAISQAAGNLGTYPLIIKLDMDEAKKLGVKSGMFGKVVFKTNKKSKTKVVPRETVITQGNEQYVFIDVEGKAKKVNVTTGIDNGCDIQITKGLNFGDKVVIKGQEYLEDGIEIKVKKG